MAQRTTLAIAAILAIATPVGAETPPLPAVYDPNPGPFAVFVGANGDIAADQYDTLQRTWNAWQGEDLEAFLLCYSNQSDQRSEFGIQKKVLSDISARLRKLDAETVLAGTPSMCSSLNHAAFAASPHVMIFGVYRL